MVECFYGSACRCRSDGRQRHLLRLATISTYKGHDSVIRVWQTTPVMVDGGMRIGVVEEHFYCSTLLDALSIRAVLKIDEKNK